LFRSKKGQEKKGNKLMEKKKKGRKGEKPFKPYLMVD